MAAQRFLYAFTELIRICCHHIVGFFERHADRVVTACPRVVQRRLIATQVYVNFFRSEALPQIDNVADVGHRNRPLLSYGFADSRNEFVEIAMKFVDPTLCVTLFRCVRIDLSYYAHDAGNVARFGLCAGHTTKTGGDEEHSFNSVLALVAAHLLASSVEHCDRRSVNNTLRADIHIRTRRHLAVLRYAQSIVALPIIRLRVVGNYHTIRYHYAGCILVRGEKSERVSGVHHQSLLVRHLT